MVVWMRGAGNGGKEGGRWECALGHGIDRTLRWSPYGGETEISRISSSSVVTHMCSLDGYVMLVGMPEERVKSWSSFLGVSVSVCESLCVSVYM